MGKTKNHGPLPHPREESRDRFGPRWFKGQECPGDTLGKVAERREISSLLKPRKVLTSSCQKPQDFSEFPELFLSSLSFSWREAKRCQGSSFPSDALMKKGVEGNSSRASCWDERVGIPFALWGTVRVAGSHPGRPRKTLRGWSMSRDRNRAGEGLEHDEKRLESS